MKNLHNILIEEYNEYQRAVLWWITVEFPIGNNDIARIGKDGLVYRVYQETILDDDYTPNKCKELIRAWKESGRPEFNKSKVIKG